MNKKNANKSSFSENIKSGFKVLFTLLELLICVAIISILMSILLPALKQTRERGKQISCSNKMKQVALGFYFYANDWNDCTPPPHVENDTWWGSGSWQQYLRNNDYIKRMGSGYSGNLGSNCYRCPSEPDFWPKDNNGYLGHFGYNYSMRFLGHEKIDKVPHKAQVYLLVESTKNWQIAVHGWFICVDYERAHLRHSHGLNAVYVDGHQKYLRRPKQPPVSPFDTLGRAYFYPYDYLNNWQ